MDEAVVHPANERPLLGKTIEDTADLPSTARTSRQIPILQLVALALAYILGLYGLHWCYLFPIFWLQHLADQRRQRRLWAALRDAAHEAIAARPNTETAKWVNQLLRTAWPLYTTGRLDRREGLRYGGLEEYTKECLEPTLNWYLPHRLIKGVKLEGIRVSRFSYGQCEPDKLLAPLHCTNVKMLGRSRVMGRSVSGQRVPRNDRAKMLLQADVHYHGGDRGIFELELRLGTPLATFEVEVVFSQLRLEGTLRIELEWQRAYPWLGTVALAFLKVPTFDFDIKFPSPLGGQLDPRAVYPQIEDYLKAQLDDLLKYYIVGSNAWTLPLGEWYAVDDDVPSDAAAAAALAAAKAAAAKVAAAAEADIEAAAARAAAAAAAAAAAMAAAPANVAQGRRVSEDGGASEEASMRLTPPQHPAASARTGPPAGAPPYSVMPLAWVGPAALADASQSSEEPPTPGKMPWALQREIRSRRGSRAGLEGGGGGVSGDALEPPLMSARDFFLAEEAPSSDAGSSKAAPELQAAAAAADAAAAVIGGPVAFARTSGVRLAENGAIEVEGLPAAEAAQMRALLDHIHRKKAAGVRVTAPPPFGGGPTPPRSPRSNGSGADAARWREAVARGAVGELRVVVVDVSNLLERSNFKAKLSAPEVHFTVTLGDATEQASRPVAPRADARSHEIDHGFALWVHDALTQRLHLRVRLKELATEVYEAGAAELSFADLAPGRPAERLVELAAPEGRGRRAGAAAVTVRLRLEYTPADLAAVDVARDATGLSVNL